jgi:hypothetical protein
VRGRLFGLLTGALLTLPAPALAAPVLVMSRNGHVHVAQDPYLNGPALTPVPAGAGLPGPTGRPAPTAAPHALDARAPSRRKRHHRPQRTFRSELLRLYRAGQISTSDYQADSQTFNQAVAAERRLGGTRAAELTAVVENLHDIAARGMLTPSRLPALMLTLGRNLQWWSNGPIPQADQRIEFTGSQLVWQYYPGQGLELQVLGTFGKADGLYTAGPTQYGALRDLLTEMIPLAATGARGTVWEYYFHFEGGAPPWTSGMAQGTAIEALTRADEAFGPQTTYLQLAHQALGLFTAAPPLGVRVPAPHGARYVQYSFAPGTDIINAFLQALIGLYDYAKTSGDPEAQALFDAGDAEAQAELPRFDTGAWSLYQPGVEDSLSYHELVTGFLDELCSRTQAAIYCTTAQHFHAYLTTPPVLTQLTNTASARRAFNLDFRLSKYSHVGVVVMRGQTTVFETSADFAYGTQSFAIPALRAGSYTVRLAATDLAGNFSRIAGTLQVSRRKG